MVQATACRAVIYGFNSHPQLHSSSLAPSQVSISLMGTITNPKRIDIYGIDKIFEQALKRLKTKTDITEEDRKSILEFSTIFWPNALHFRRDTQSAGG